jgi:hypothetical protein
MRKLPSNKPPLPTARKENTDREKGLITDLNPRTSSFWFLCSSSWDFRGMETVSSPVDRVVVLLESW